MPQTALPDWKNYLDVVPADALGAQLSAHLHRAAGILSALPEEKAAYAYAPGKWTVRQVVGHVLVAHRVFVSRAVCVARGESQPLPGFDENVYAADWPGEGALAAFAAAYAAEAAATLAWVGILRPAELEREGVANNMRIRPSWMLRALIGHENHHIRILHERYGVAP